MKEISKKLRDNALKDFSGVINDMAKSGCRQDEIIKSFQAQLRIKTNQYYEKLRGLRSFRDIYHESIAAIKAGSKAEIIFYNLLLSSGVKFEFQFKIGPYTADYLIARFLVVELDGPQHEQDHDDRRDVYMRKMGYKIIRVPLFVLMSCPEAVIEEIQEAIKIKRVK